MLHTTFNLLRRAGACETGYRKLAKRLGGATKYGKDAPIQLAAVLDSNGIDDALWCLRATVEPSKGFARDFACDCADLVASLLTGERSLTAITVARLYARGQATDNDLSAAMDAAWGASCDASCDAARAAARAALADRFAARLAAHDPDTNPLGEVPERMPCLVIPGDTPCAA